MFRAAPIAWLVITANRRNNPQLAMRLSAAQPSAGEHFAGYSGKADSVKLGSRWVEPSNGFPSHMGFSEKPLQRASDSRLCRQCSSLGHAPKITVH
jgi:hypothetical protein